MRAGLKPGLCKCLPLMTNPINLPCDGCGRAASAEHIARRLQRLEWTTRYRPVHINTLLLGAFSPWEDKDFLYCPSEEFGGEAAQLLDALGIARAGKTAEVVHAEFQRGGYFLTHVLECPPGNEGESKSAVTDLLEKRLDPVARRIRRSLKPKRVVLISLGLAPILEKIVALELGCPVVLDDGRLFELEEPAPENSAARLRAALAGTSGV
jgi:hypothetical protein